MKKIIALVVAILMIASMSVVAFAAPVSTDFTANEATVPGGTDLIYNVSQTYTVTIPASLEFTASDLDIEDEVSASVVKIANTKKLSIFMASSTSLVVDADTTITKDAWTLVDTNELSDPVDYDATYGDSATAVTTAAILVVTMDDMADDAGATDGAEGSVAIQFATEGTSQVGNYKDLLTFTTAVTDK